MPKVLLIIERLSKNNDSYQTWHGLQTSCLSDQGVDHWWCLLYYESIKPQCAIWLNAPPWIRCGPNSRWCIQPDAKVTVTWMSLKHYTGIRTKHANLVSTKWHVHMYGKLLRNEVQEKMSEGTVWRARVTWSKGTLTWDWSSDLTSVQNRSMCSAVKYSLGQLSRDVWFWTRHKKEKRVGDEMVWWAESQWCIRRDTACV